jgi:hypothetical protein
MKIALAGLGPSALEPLSTNHITDCAGFGSEWVVKGFDYGHLGFEGLADVNRLRCHAMVPQGPV